MSRKLVLGAVSLALVLLPAAAVESRPKKTAPPEKKPAAVKPAAEADEDPFAVPRKPAAKPAETPAFDAAELFIERVNDGTAKPPAEKPAVCATPPARPSSAARAKTGPLRVGEKAILQALEEPVTLKYVQAPLSDFVDHLRKELRVATVLDKKALDDVGVGTDTPITCDLADIPLRSALELVLHGPDLTWTVRSDVLFITTPQADERYLVTEVYDVSDLIVPVRDQPYRGGLPGLGALPGSNAGGFGPGPDLHTTDLGPGYFNVSPNPAAPAAPGGAGSGSTTPAPGSGTSPGFICGGIGGISGLPRRADDRMDALVDLITGTVAPTSWDTVGGPGSIQRLEPLLAINQTFHIHREVQALLADLRAKRAAVPTLVIDLRWLWLDADGGELLLGSSPPPGSARISLAVDPKTLERLGRTAPGFRGRIACTNGQLVHVASGDRRSSIVSAIPVIGNRVGYQPVIAVPNAGVLLELRPTAGLAGTDAVLDVQSTVTRWGEQPPMTQVRGDWPPGQINALRDKPGPEETGTEPGESAAVPLERPMMPAEQFAATVRVPLGKPIVLGAMSFAPADDAGLDKPAEPPKQLYLIATTYIASADPEATPRQKRRR